MSKKNRKISVKELVLYCICAAFVLWGLVYTVLGLIVTYAPLKTDNPLIVANNTIRSLFGLGYLGWGLILTAAFAVVAVIVMTAFAKDVDKSYEKNQRRAARLNRNKVVDVPVEENLEANENAQ